MKTNARIIAAGVFAVCLSGALDALAQGSAFTYQGRLSNSGGPANGAYALQFTLKDAATGGSSIGVPVAIAPLAVSNGLFTATLDFGGAAFTGAARWLEIGVRTNGSVAAYTVLAPRQALTPTPYAMLAGTAASVPAANLSGTVSTSQLPANVARLDVNETFTGQVNFNGGRVGINTTNPLGKLDVTGTAVLGGPWANLDGFNFSSFTNTGRMLLGWNYHVGQGESDFIANRGNAALGGFAFMDLANDGTITHLMKLNGDGNVGIGTHSPTVKLDVAGQIRSSFDNDAGGQLVLNNPRKSGAAARDWKLFNMTGVYGDSLQLWNYPVSGGTYSRFRINDDGTTILSPSGGNVGIGTATPENKLQVGSGWIQMDPGYGAGSQFVTVGGWYRPNFGMVIHNTSEFGSLNFLSHPWGHSPNFAFRSALDNSAWMVIQNGSVGIGTLTPGQRLSVAGVVESTTGGFKFPDGSVQTTASSGGGGGLGGSGTAGYVPKFTASTTVGNSSLYESSGSLGIGTTSPHGRLEIAGSSVLNGESANLAGGDLSFLRNSGKLLLGWNRLGGPGETDFIANRGTLGASGGFSFFDLANDGTLKKLMTVGGDGNVSVLDTLSANTLSAGSGGVAFDDGSFATSATDITSSYFIPSQQEVTTVGASTWTVPSGVSRVRVRVWGGGGGGSNTGTGGGGGGGGGYAQYVIVGPAAGEVLDLTVGAGGAVNAAGGQSKVVRRNGTVTLAVANGGARGSGANGGAGGTATTGQVRRPGDAGLSFDDGSDGGSAVLTEFLFEGSYSYGGQGYNSDMGYTAQAGEQGYILIEY